MCYALQSSLQSILNDEELDETGAESAMQESLNEFLAAMQGAVTKWANGKEAGIVIKSEAVSAAELDRMEAVVEKLNESIAKTVKEGEARLVGKSKKRNRMMAKRRKEKRRK